MPDLPQLGVGAIVVILVLKEFVSFAGVLTKGKNGKSAGSLPPEFWQMEFRKAVTDGIAPQLRVLQRIQETLQEILIITKRAHGEHDR